MTKATSSTDTDTAGGPKRRNRGIVAAAFAIAKVPLRAAANLILPPVCLSCHEPMTTYEALCAPCWRGVDFITPPLCDRLGLPLPFDTGDTMISAAAAARPPPYSRARAVARYDGTMRRLVHQFKFSDTQDARQLFATWASQAGAELLAEADVLVPVPLNRYRLLTRRFNQSAVLATALSKRTGLPTRPLSLVRTRRTRQQVGLTQNQRRDNVRGAFAVPPRHQRYIAGKHVVLIDDVITTGATIDACSIALLKAGARQVDVLALAKVTTAEIVTT